MNIKDKDRFEVELIAHSYYVHKRRIKEYEENIKSRPYEEIKAAQDIVNHIDAVINDLNEKDKFIIENEIVNGKEGKWYMFFLSSSTYYRQRKKAYKSFLRCLEE